MAVKDFFKNGNVSVQSYGEVQHLEVHVTHVRKKGSLLVSVVTDHAVTGIHAPGLQLTFSKYVPLLMGD